MRSFSRAWARSVALAGFATLAFAIPAVAGPDFIDRLDARLDAFTDRLGDAAGSIGLERPELPVIKTQLFGSDDSRAIAQLDSRMTNLETQMRQLTGQIDQLSHQIRQFEDRLRRPGGAPDERGDSTNRPPRRSDTPGIDRSTGQFTAAAQTDQPTGPGAPPRTLGRIPTDATGEPVDLAEIIRGSVGEATGDISAKGTQTASILPPGASSKDSYDLAYGYIAGADYDHAEKGFRDFLSRFPDDQLAGNAQFWLGESFYHRGKFREAADAYLQVYTKFANSTKAPESLVKLGASLRQLNEKDAACATLGEFGKRYPKAPSSLRKQVGDESQRAGCS